MVCQEKSMAEPVILVIGDRFVALFAFIALIALVALVALVGLVGFMEVHYFSLSLSLSQL